MTPFGRMLRRERKDRNMLLGELARRLDISIAYLSQIEHGKRAIPDGFERRVADTLELSAEERNEMERAAAISRQTFEIDVTGANDNDRELARDLALAFARLSPEGKNELRRVIDGDEA